MVDLVLRGFGNLGNAVSFDPGTTWPSDEASKYVSGSSSQKDIGGGVYVPCRATLVFSAGQVR